MTGAQSPTAAPTEDDEKFTRLAYAEAQAGYNEGGVPVGAVMVHNGQVFARGRNKRVQEGSPIMHGETDCLSAAGMLENYQDVTLYTTLSPCMMCTGAILHFDIKRVVIGENVNFPGNIEMLLSKGVQVVLMNDPDCKALMARFIEERPDIWFEDIGGKETT